jgi:hypothetical protein
LDVSQVRQTNQSLAGWRMIQREFQTAIGSEKKKKGPMGHAFVTTNPLLPKEYFAPAGIDELVLSMNKGVPNSLLDCPGKYTVLVATFKGQEVIKQDEIRTTLNEKRVTRGLADAADKAAILTEALRMKGYEAYQFHDRYASIVTVGSFNSVGTPRPDGKIEINPKVHTILKTFGGEPAIGPTGPAYKPKKMGPFNDVGEIFFDIQPIPVQAPKRSISAAYSRSTATLR